jgi:hypothetical protein
MRAADPDAEPIKAVQLPSSGALSALRLSTLSAKRLLQNSVDIPLPNWKPSGFQFGRMIARV